MNLKIKEAKIPYEVLFNPTIDMIKKKDLNQTRPIHIMIEKGEIDDAAHKVWYEVEGNEGKI